MTLDIPRGPLDGEPYDLWRQHRDRPGASMSKLGVGVVAQALYDEAGLTPGAYDERIAKWLGEFELSIAVTVASWIVRAYEAGLASASADRTSFVAIGEHVYAPMPDQPRTSPGIPEPTHHCVSCRAPIGALNGSYIAADGTSGCDRPHRPGVEIVDRLPD